MQGNSRFIIALWRYSHEVGSAANVNAGSFGAGDRQGQSGLVRFTPDIDDGAIR